MPILDPSLPISIYETLLDALPIVAWMADADGVPTFFSAGWQRLTGLDAREYAGPRYLELIHPDDREAASATWLAACAAGEAYRDEMRLHFGDGRHRWIVSQADPLHHPDGTVAAWIGSVTDVDDLHAATDRLTRALDLVSTSAREALERSSFAERLMDANDDCIKILDLDTRLVDMSKNGQKALAIDDFELVRGATWLDFWHGADRAAAETAVAEARAGRRGHFVGRYAVRGEDRFWDVNVTTISAPDGTPERFLVVSRDVTAAETDRRELAGSRGSLRVLSEALPGVVWSASADGRLESVSSGDAPLERGLGTTWIHSVHEDDREPTLALWQHSVTTGEPYDASFRVRSADGTYRWQLAYGLCQRDEAGAIQRWFGVNVDVDDRRRASAARDQLARVVEASDDLIGIADSDGRMTYANVALREALGLPESGELGEIRRADVFEEDAGAFAERQRAASAGDSVRGEGRLRGRTAVGTIPIAHTTFGLSDESGRPTGVATIARDLRERRRVEIGMRALAEAGAAMYGSLDVRATIVNVTAAVASGFASWCSIEMLEEDGTIHTLAATHRDPAMQASIERATAARDFTAEHPAVRAIRGGESTLMKILPADWHDRIGVARKIGTEDVARLDTRSVVSVPIRSTQDSRTFGSLTCAIDGSDPRGHYTAEDIRFAEEIAVRAALAFEHARSYERERRIAVTLQEASLPGVLPTVDHLYLSAEYRPGKSEATIGGDWYDAFPLDDGRVVVTIGDVLGNGLAAAVTMSKVRQAMQSVAMVVPDPLVMLTSADRTVRAQSSEAYATALAGIFDPRTHVFTFASAGHPGPVVRSPDGAIEAFESPGLLLGLRPPGGQTREVQTAPGGALVFFTDGLVEATRDIDEGTRRLCAAIADPHVMAAESPAAALVEHVLGGGPGTDDIAVLVAEIGPSERFDRRLRTARERALELAIAEPAPAGEIGVAVATGGGTVVTLPSDLFEIATARRTLRTLLATSETPRDLIETAELAAGELVANAMEHGSGQAVTFAVRSRPDAIVIAVTNDGAIFAPEAVDFSQMLDRERGRGLAILRSLGWEIAIEAPEAARCCVTATLRR